MIGLIDFFFVFVLYYGYKEMKLLSERSAVIRNEGGDNVNPLADYENAPLNPPQQV